MIDFHTHILFQIDDGARSIEKSVKMLEEAYKKGTDVVVLTSHCCPSCERNLNEFLMLRKNRYQQLKKACAGRAVPELRLGAEVLVCPEFTSLNHLHDLCIEGTDYMLVEMPRTPWQDWMIESVYNLTLKGIKPVMAHIDRYMQFPSHMLAALAEIGPAYQVNSDALLTRTGRRVVLYLYKKGWIHVLGSDMHGTVKRKNTLPDAYIKLEETFGEEYIRFVEDNGFRILKNEPVIRRTSFPRTKKRKLFF